MPSTLVPLDVKRGETGFYKVGEDMVCEMRAIPLGDGKVALRMFGAPMTTAEWQAKACQRAVEPALAVMRSMQASLLRSRSRLRVLQEAVRHVESTREKHAAAAGGNRQGPPAPEQPRSEEVREALARAEEFAAGLAVAAAAAAAATAGAGQGGGAPPTGATPMSLTQRGQSGFYRMSSSAASSRWWPAAPTARWPPSTRAASP